MTTRTLAHDLRDRLAQNATWRGNPIPTDMPVGEVIAQVNGLDPGALLDQTTMVGDSYGQLAEHWTRMAAELLAVAREGDAGVGLAIPDVVVVDRIDTHLVNAVSYVLSDGSALVVLNEALIVLVWEVVRVIASRVQVVGDGGPGVTLEAASEALSAVLDWMRLCSHPHPVDLPLTANQLAFAGSLAYAVEQFLIAHEVAHIALGHHAGRAASRKLLVEVAGEVPLDNDDESAPDPDPRDEELLADSLAIMLVVRARAKRSGSAGPLFAVDGARLFFALQQEVERAVATQRFASPIRIVDDTTHPSALTRSLVLRGVLTRHVTGVDVWGESGVTESVFARLVGMIGPARDRDDAAAALLAATLERHATIPVPDYAGFRFTVSTEWRPALEPTLLAAAAEALVRCEREIECPDLAVAAKAYQQFKLLYSYVRDAREPVRGLLLSFREMYRRAGGQLSTALFDPPSGDSPASALLG